MDMLTLERHIVLPPYVLLRDSNCLDILVYHYDTRCKSDAFSAAVT